MAAIFSFGSFGDIITLVQLTYSLASAIRDTKAHHEQYEELAQYLDAFGQNLESLRPYVERSGSSTMDQAATIQIRNALTTCERLMRQFMDKYTLVQSPQMSSLRYMGKRLKWAVRWVMSAEDDAIEQQRELFSTVVHRVTQHVPKLEPDEEKAQKHTKTLVDDGTAFLTRVRKQEAAVQTWYVEAFNRDRGAVD